MRTGTAVDLSHQVIRNRIGPGAVAVDATAGNGLDTLFLANLVCPDGVVHAFDIQAEAVRRTEKRLRENNINVEVVLRHVGHEFAAATLAEAGVTAIDAAMFNLGYLPRSDHAIITRPDTTVRALDGLLPLLGKEGIVTVVTYLGHAGGTAEADAVGAFLRQLDPAEFTSRHYRPTPQRRNSPELLVIERTRPSMP